MLFIKSQIKLNSAKLNEDKQQNCNENRIIFLIIRQRKIT